MRIWLPVIVALLSSGISLTAGPIRVEMKDSPLQTLFWVYEDNSGLTISNKKQFVGRCSIERWFVSSEELVSYFDEYLFREFGLTVHRLSDGKTAVLKRKLPGRLRVK